MNKYKTEAGRCITRNGKPFVTIGKCEDTAPVDADRFATVISDVMECLEFTVAASMENKYNREALITRLQEIAKEL